MNIDIKNFKFLIEKKVPPIELNREESKTVCSLRIGVLGLNRMKIQKDAVAQSQHTLI